VSACGMRTEFTESGRRASGRRGRVVHADSLKREPVLEADARPFVGRMVLAAYEVVLNKARLRRPGSLPPFGSNTGLAQRRPRKMLPSVLR
jgi:hypothetical protein